MAGAAHRASGSPWMRPVVIGAALLLGCASPAPRTREVPALPGPALRSLVRSELFFGLSRPDGSLVAETDWRRFLAEEVTPRFPAGLTVLEADGQYRDQAGRLVREPSRLVVILHDPAPGPTAAIEEIRAAYRRQFDQESVLLVRTTVDVGF